MYTAVLPPALPACKPWPVLLHDRQLPQVSSDQILLLEGTGNYTLFHLRNGRRQMTSRTLLSFEQALRGQPFFRIHKSYLISLREVARLELGTEPRVWLPNGQCLGIARRRRQAFMACLQQFAMLPQGQ